MKEFLGKFLLYLFKKLGMPYNIDEHRILTEFLKKNIFIGIDVVNVSSMRYTHNGKLYFLLTLETGGVITVYFELRGINVKFGVYSADNINLEYNTFLKKCQDIIYCYTLDDDNKANVEAYVRVLLTN